MKYFILIFFIFSFSNQKQTTHNFPISQISIQLVSEENSIYYGSIPVSIGNQKLYLLVDTTIALSWVPSSNLNLTKYNLTQSYNHSLSKTFKFVNPHSNETTTVFYKEGDVFGYLMKDKFTINDLDFNFTFIEVAGFENNFKSNYYGKFALSYKVFNNISDSDPLFLFQNKSLISEKIFCIDENVLHFGGVPEKYIDYPYSSCNLIDTLLIDDEFKYSWTCELTHVIFGGEDKNFDDAIDLSPSYVIFDKNYKYIGIPKIFLNTFKENLFNKYLYGKCKLYEDNEESFFICKKSRKYNFLKINFIIDGYGYVINMKKLLKEKEDGTFELLLRFRNENDNIFSLGKLFFGLYTLVFNQDKKVVQFLGGEREVYEQEWNHWKISHEVKKESQVNTVINVGIIIIVYTLILVISLHIYYCVHKNKKKLIYSKEMKSLIKNEVESNNN